MSIPRLSLAQQLAQLEEAAPVDFDPEDIQITGNDPEDTTQAETQTDLSAAREHYVDVGPSTLRKLHDSVADPKYDGIRTTRKQLMEDSEGITSERDDDDWTNGVEELFRLSNGRSDEDPQKSVQEDDSGEDTEPEQRPVKPSTSNRLDTIDDFSSTLRKTRDHDRKKGKAVTRQIAIWDSLLDARIRLQKAANAANQLPLPSELGRFTTSLECRDSIAGMLEEAALLSDELFQLRETLMTSNELIKPPPRKRRKMLENNTGADYEVELNEASQDAIALEHAFHPYLLQTLSKWSSKIQAVAPSILLPSNRNAFSSKSSQHIKSAVQLVDEALVDHSKVLVRTQTRRGKGVRLGRVIVDEEEGKEDGFRDTEIFDDTDFYQQLLRDVIDTRGNAVGGGDDWMVLQKQKKAKKKVDTKASKGRKIRYEVHDKIQNFMVPVPVQGMWHEEQIDELFASLLGKGFEHANGAEDIEDGDAVESDDALIIKDGFRVFG